MENIIYLSYSRILLSTAEKLDSGTKYNLKPGKNNMQVKLVFLEIDKLMFVEVGRH